MFKLGKIGRLQVFLQVKPDSAITMAFPTGDRGFHLEVVLARGQPMTVEQLREAGGCTNDLNRLVVQKGAFIAKHFMPTADSPLILREHQSLADEKQNVVVQYMLLPNFEIVTI